MDTTLKTVSVQRFILLSGMKEAICRRKVDHTKESGVAEGMRGEEKGLVLPSFLQCSLNLRGDGIRVVFKAEALVVIYSQHLGSERLQGSL